MTETAVETVDVHPITFPPPVFARISPELSLQRHLSLGIRPSLRSFEEFREVNINEGTLSRFGPNGVAVEETGNNVLGSNVLKCGNTFVVTSITGGIVEINIPVDEEDIGEKELMEISEKRDYVNKCASVFPQIEVERGRTGAPTDEEMTISQKLYDNVLHSGLISKSALDVDCGIRITDSTGKTKIVYFDETKDGDMSQFRPKRKWAYVLYAKIVVFSRTGPVFDMCWNSLVYALKDTKLPRVFIDERATDLKMTVRTRGRSAVVRESYDILFDSKKAVPLKINEFQIGFASNYGIIDLDPEAQVVRNDEGHDVDEEMDKPRAILLADIDSEAEETSINSTISVIGDSSGKLTNVTIVGGGSKITLEMIKRALALSKARYDDLKTKS
ncbi:hypothetical protein HG535_0A01540 [Zygotorulaspora mrakii]|uniref:Ribosomal RNA-processing protein 43 n=1 Tax=Zygotorulaspora mrakii TaxID=42260 RepID=A0A7H9AV99_ZYGMR|nr:uncharacterized protein HG535_0A01540 [Zygotorulaspora mrakii]QLG70216.1 hypothetical protein HG535_0A01540 [Zygotorulaspora mrakii]